MTNIRNRTILIAAAVAAALGLTACDTREERAARSDAKVATAPAAPSAPSSTPYASDRVTADASSAAARAGDAPKRDAATTAADAALTAKVKAALMAEPGIESLQIDVDTVNNRVTLTGQVDDTQHRQRAIEVARNVEGVSGVVDRLSVKR